MTLVLPHKINVGVLYHKKLTVSMHLTNVQNGKSKGIMRRKWREGEEKRRNKVKYIIKKKKQG